MASAAGAIDVLGDALVAAARAVTVEAAEELLARRYGLRSTVTPLAGEKDSNFHVSAADGQEFLLKIVHGGEDKAIVKLQTLALLHIADRDPDMPVQRIVRTLDGAPDFEATFESGPTRMVRLVTFMTGALQRNTRPNREQRENVGSALARLQLALADFRHPAEDHKLVWDLKHADELRPLTAAVQDADDRVLLEQILDRFETHLRPQLDRARVQAVHNDLSSDNIVVDERDPTTVRGILDFGDLVRTPVAVDVAVAAAYQLTGLKAPLEGALDLIRGFHRVRALEPAEVDMLFDLILTRMVVRIAITEWRAARFPENREYIVRNTPLSWDQLRALSALPRLAAVDRIKSACDPNRSH